MIDKKLKTVNEIYEEFIEHTPEERIVFYFDDKPVTLKEVKHKVDSFTGALKESGAAKSTFIGYSLPNSLEVIALFTAISRLGACAVPLFPMTPDSVKINIYKKARTRLVITTARQLPSMKEAADRAGTDINFATIDPNELGVPVLKGNEDSTPEKVEPSQPLMMASSSGTTGIPKPVLLTQGNIATEIKASVFMSAPLDGCLQDDYLAAMAFPLSTSGLITVLGYLYGGRRQLYSTDVSPMKFMELASKLDVESLAAPPAYLEGILTLPPVKSFDFSKIRSVQTGMDFLSPSLLKRLKEKFINLNSFTNGYGLVETSNVFMCSKGLLKENEELNPSLMTLIDPDSNSIQVKDKEGKLVPPGERGELYVKGDNIIQGYLGPPELSAPNFHKGWFKTGDIVRNEGENRITLLGRAKYLIKRGGKSISPIVVQDLINKIPGVIDSAVVGIPQQLYGEMIWAFIVCPPEITLKEIMRQCRKELPNYMVPDSITFINAIPKNPGAGKVNFEKLKEMAAAELTSMEDKKNGTD